MSSWFGMKANIGLHTASELVHTVIGTTGNVTNVLQAHALLPDDKTAALSDAGYQGVEKRPENIGKSVTWPVAMSAPNARRCPITNWGA